MRAAGNPVRSSYCSGRVYLDGIIRAAGKPVRIGYCSGRMYLDGCDVGNN